MGSQVLRNAVRGILTAEQIENMNLDEMIMAIRKPETDSKTKKALHKSIRALTACMTVQEILFKIEETAADRVMNSGADSFYAAKEGALENEIMRRCGALID